MTEIQWLCDILLNHKLPQPVKDKFIERIGQVEASLHKAPVQNYIPVPTPHPMAQAPSTQRILAEMAQPNIPIKLPPAEIDKETGRAVVQTGNGTRGPRKF